jgi:hypothetical protein
MQSRWIIAGITVTLAVGALTAYAADSHGDAVSSLTRTTQLRGSAHGDVVSTLASQNGVVRSAQAKEDASKRAESATCEVAENALKALRASDRTEDRTERSAEHNATSRAADRTEDAAEKDEAKAAHDAVKSKCGREETVETAACEAAENALDALKNADRTEDRAEKARAAADKSEDRSERAAVRSAEQAVDVACAA